MSDNQTQWWSSGASPAGEAWDRIVEPTPAAPTRRSRRDLRTPAPEPERAPTGRSGGAGGSGGSDRPGKPDRPGGSGRSGGSGRGGRHRGRSILVLVVALAMVLGAGYVVYTLLRPGSTPGQVQDYPGPGHPSVQVVVNTGDTGGAMARTLHSAGVVATETAFVRAYAANPNAAKIQPGTYNLMLEMKASDAVTALLDPANKASLKVTIPEGLTTAQIVQKISEKTTIPLADLQAAAADPNAIGLPAQAGGKVEGWLFPATYEVDPKATAASVLTQMTKKTVDVLTAKNVAADQWKTVLTKASLIEREVKLDTDRPKVARAIENRLAKGMILQIDTSTAYGLNKSAMDLTKADLADATNPYNLYQVAGLPPTPICSPGGSSIDAVLAPAAGSWLFWETINLDTGETVFSETKADHDAAVKQYDAWAATQKASATATP